MTNHQKAFKEAAKELEKDNISEIKEMMKSLLQRMQEEKEKKAKAEDALRLLKLDMDDLRSGKIEKIRNRHDESKRVREISPLKDADLTQLQYFAGGGAVGNFGAMTKGNLQSTLTASGTAGLQYQPLQALGGAATSQSINWSDATSGTYQIQCSNGSTKEMNL